jgi:hypothetical protein
VLYNTTTYNRGRVEPLVSLLFSFSDDPRLRFPLVKGSVVGVEFSTGEILCNDAEEKSESDSDSDELEDSKVTRR